MSALQHSLGNANPMSALDSDSPEPKAKILFFTPSLGHGGAEMHLLRVVNALDRSQFQVAIALTQTGGTYEASLANDVPLYSVSSTTIRSSTLRMVRAIAPLRHLVQTEQPDIVCAMQDHANVAALKACQGLPKRPKVVVCVQNAPLTQYRHRWHPRDLAMRLFLSQFYPRADQIIALSHGVAQDLHTLVPRTLAPIEVIYNAGMNLDVEEWAKDSLLPEERPQVPLIVACGRLHEQKGFSYLLKAMARIRQAIPAQLWIVGEGPLRPFLERQIQQLALTDAVRLLGFQQNPYKYMAAADVFVLSSLYEGFGNVVVEAMACGAPVVATDCTHGPAEILEQGEYGVLVPPRDVDALAQGILSLLEDVSLRHKFVQCGKQRSHQFHAQSIAAQYANLFLQMLHSDSSF